MRRLRVEYLPEAHADLQSVFDVVLRASQNIDVAEGFVRRMYARCERIGHAPRGGRPRDDLEPGLRTVPFERSAAIAYRVESDHVPITNVFYGGRDYEALFRGPSDQDEPD